MRFWLKCVVLPGLFVGAIVDASCRFLPHRAYAEVTKSPTSTHFGPEDEYAFTIGVETDLQPAPVVVVGQQQKHPFDLRGALGIYSEEDFKPTPLIVKDEEMRLLLADLRAAMEENAEATRLMAADVSAMSVVIVALKAEWDSVNTTMLGGGGLTTLGLMIFFGLRHFKKPQPKGDSA